MTAATARARGLRDAEGSEGKHRSLSPVHPLAPSPDPPPLAPRRHASSARFTLSSSLLVPLPPPAAPSPSPSPSPSPPSTPVSRPPRFSSLPSLYPSRCYLSLPLPPRRGLFFLSLGGQATSTERGATPPRRARRLKPENNEPPRLAFFDFAPVSSFLFFFPFFFFFFFFPARE